LDDISRVFSSQNNVDRLLAQESGNIQTIINTVFSKEIRFFQKIGFLGHRISWAPIEIEKFFQKIGFLGHRISWAPIEIEKFFQKIGFLGQARFEKSDFSKKSDFLAQSIRLVPKSVVLTGGMMISALLH
jgi:hypothetical protein